MIPTRRLDLFPCSTTIFEDRLQIGGCDLAELAAVHGTPLYLYDAATLDSTVTAYQSALAAHYAGPSAVTYAGKAGLITALTRWAAARGLWIDCTGLGELQVASAAGVDRGQILVHGVNKSAAELDLAVRMAGIIVVDNLTELDRLLAMAASGRRLPELWLRIRPGTAVETHAFRQTGQSDSKFGLSTVEAQTAVVRCQAAGVALSGIHFHQGSHFHDPAPIAPGLDAVLDLVAAVRGATGWVPRVLCPGGGWGVAYHEDDLPQPSIDAYVAFVAAKLAAGCAARGLPLPVLHLEPGRSIVARAGVALYTVGAVKQTATRRWLLVDGGMADNIRPALYGARYSALPVREPLRAVTEPVWIGGPYCESGDVLISDLPMAEFSAGDLLAVPASGAYHLSMASNYNGACRPAVLWLRDGCGHLIRRREDPAHLVALDCPLPDGVG